MDRHELIKNYLDFFKSKKHSIISGAPVIPEHDPSVLFTTAGMHPLVPFLLGQPHAQGSRLTDVQRCIRTGDIEDVGDDTHLTFFEMLGNWSLGDYFKEEAIKWSFEFLIKVLKFDKKKLHVTVFEGEKNIPRDEESVQIWKSLGIPKERIYYLPREDNWWGPAGETGPCGPDTEMFIDSGKPKCNRKCIPGCGCGKYVEIWNDVFMQYNKTKEGKYEALKQKNVDTGMGVERTIAMINEKKTVYDTHLFTPLIKIVKKLAKKQNEKSIRIIVDHVRAATFILGDERGVTPSNVDQGYVLRRLIRRAIRHGKILGIEQGICQEVAKKVINMYGDYYISLKDKENFILNQFTDEEKRFLKTLEKGLHKFEKLSNKNIDAKSAFLLFQSYGFPIEMTVELAKEKGLNVDVKGFNNEFIQHQKLSRVGAENRFKGGLADTTIQTTKLHTATHLLAQALRNILDKNIKQKGSNITSKRLRFDFNFPRKVTREELDKVENLVNKIINKQLPIIRKEMTFKEAKRLGAQAEFETKYGDKVFVYSVGDFSKEVCGGPHVKNTKELGRFKIVKEKSVGAGVRRIKAVLED